ncbi:MAG: hypothetical protein JSW71_14680, partial [Gemmatimonadota bacterium]
MKRDGRVGPVRLPVLDLRVGASTKGLPDIMYATRTGNDTVRLSLLRRIVCCPFGKKVPVKTIPTAM